MCRLGSLVAELHVWERDVHRQLTRIDLVVDTGAMATAIATACAVEEQVAVVAANVAMVLDEPSGDRWEW